MSNEPDELVDRAAALLKAVDDANEAAILEGCDPPFLEMAARTRALVDLLRRQ